MRGAVEEKPPDTEVGSSAIMQCAWCGRVKRHERYSGESLPIVKELDGRAVSHGICPTCFSRVYAKACMEETLDAETVRYHGITGSEDLLCFRPFTFDDILDIASDASFPSFRPFGYASTSQSFLCSGVSICRQEDFR